MLTIISPAKTLDFENDFGKIFSSNPIFFEEKNQLVEAMKSLKINDLQDLMAISENLAKLNFARFQDFAKQPSSQAILAFDGDVYNGFDKKNFNKNDYEFAQNHLVILSGLYGLLRPLDSIQPYRLEMGTDFKKIKFICKNLYQFWGDKITLQINKYDDELLINLASNEYFLAINKKICNKKIIDIIFKENKNNQYKIVGISSKIARGLMANFIIKNKINKINDLSEFNLENYQFSKNLSSENQMIFIR
jgi:cytoplasmic iron level regulating protein YaaA (DUF328/UPF0246 family)